MIFTRSFSDSQLLLNYTAKMTTTGPMSLEICLQLCASHGFDVSTGYAGAEFGSQCFCGKTLSSTALPEPDADCEAMKCPRFESYVFVSSSCLQTARHVALFVCFVWTCCSSWLYTCAAQQLQRGLWWLSSYFGTSNTLCLFKRDSTVCHPNRLNTP